MIDLKFMDEIDGIQNGYHRNTKKYKTDNDFDITVSRIDDKIFYISVKDFDGDLEIRFLPENHTYSIRPVCAAPRESVDKLIQRIKDAQELCEYLLTWEEAQ